MISSGSLLTLLPILLHKVDIRRVRVPSDQKLPASVTTTGCTKLVLKALSEVIKYPFKPEQLLTGDIKKDAERVFLS